MLAKDYETNLAKVEEEDLPPSSSSGPVQL